MVGDTKYDAEGAKEEGVDCALLRVGYAQEGEIEACNPAYAFDDFDGLTEFLLKE
jgi:phosphoglycolate phosphatase-like HAD superfamily hydrolase